MKKIPKWVIIAASIVVVAVIVGIVLFNVNKGKKNGEEQTTQEVTTVEEVTTEKETTTEDTTTEEVTTEDETMTETPTEAPTEALTEAIVLVNISAIVADGTYYIGDNLSANKITVIAEYSNGGKIIGVEGWSANNLKLSSSSNTITISYGGKTCAVTVKAIEKKSEKPTEAPTKPNNVVKAEIKDDTNYLVTEVVYTNGIPDPGKTVFSYRQLHLFEGPDPDGVELAKAFLKYPLIANVMKGKNIIQYSAYSDGSSVAFDYIVEVKEGECERYAFSFDDYDIYGTFVFDGVCK